MAETRHCLKGWQFSSIVYHMQCSMISYTLWAKFYLAKSLPHINDYVHVKDTVTLLHYSTKYFRNAKVHVAGLGGILEDFNFLQDTSATD